MGRAAAWEVLASYSWRVGLGFDLEGVNDCRGRGGDRYVVNAADEYTTNERTKDGGDPVVESQSSVSGMLRTELYSRLYAADKGTAKTKRHQRSCSYPGARTHDTKF